MENPITITIFDDTSITANFVVDEWALNISVYPEGMGSVTISPLKPIYHYGEMVTLTATANPCWSFGGWVGDVRSTGNPLVLTITGNTNITAIFTNSFCIYLPLILKN